jgi:hypothetical protein
MSFPPELGERGCGSRKWDLVESIAYYRVMVDPWNHGTVNPVCSDVDGYICPIAAVFAGGECGATESVASVSEIRAKAKNPVC